jgi:hypothetical protein
VAEGPRACPRVRRRRRTREPAWQLAQPDAAAVVAQAFRDKVAQGRARVVGRGRVDGHEALQLHETVKPLRAALPGAAAPVRPSPPLEIDTWVDPRTYVPVRTRSKIEGRWSQVDSTWLPRTAANVAETKVVIPDGFRRIHPSVYSGSDKVVVTRAGPCGHS